VRVCSDCGLSIGEAAPFCPVCGRGTERETPLPAPAAPAPRPRRRVACDLCGYPGPFFEVESFRLCARCRDDLDLLLEREPHGAAGSLAAVYAAVLDGQTCPACRALDGAASSDLAEAQGWTPNPGCGSPGGCRCVTAHECTSLQEGEVRAFLEYAQEHILPLSPEEVAGFHRALQAREEKAALISGLVPAAE
jgi:hypothetical protein